MIKENSIILFQGDSITDAGRSYDKSESDLGNGYPLKVKEFLNTFFKERNITVLNRGISGNRVADLKARWDIDCIDLKPDYVSILIGVNDTWRKYDANDETSAKNYEEAYRDILKRTKKANPDCQIIILEPFLIPTDPEKNIWYEDLVWKQQAARRLAREFEAEFIPFDGIFASKCINTEPSVWSADGVHPTDCGHSFIARLWLDVMLGTK